MSPYKSQSTGMVESKGKLSSVNGPSQMRQPKQRTVHCSKLLSNNDARNMRHSPSFTSFFRRSPIESKLAKLIKIHDPIKDVYKKLANTKFIILTSKYEAMPLVLLEAMHAGCVILCLDAPGVRDLIRDGENGICKKTTAELVNSYEIISKDERLYNSIQKSALKEQLKYYSYKNLEQVTNLLLE